MDTDATPKNYKASTFKRLARIASSKLNSLSKIPLTPIKNIVKNDGSFFEEIIRGYPTRS